MEFQSKTRHGRPVTKGGTLYFGKHSERWALKMYCKAEELECKTGRLPDELIGKGIEQWAENKLRVELRLHNKELVKLGLDKAKNFNSISITKLFNEYMSRLKMTDQIRLSDKLTNELPSSLIETYTLWSEGHDVRSMIRSKSTYYRRRKQLMEFGINIDIRPHSNHSNNVIPMFRVLEAKPAEVPNWAFDNQLIHYSAKRA